MKCFICVLVCLHASLFCLYLPTYQFSQRKIIIPLINLINSRSKQMIPVLWCYNRTYHQTCVVPLVDVLSTWPDWLQMNNHIDIKDRNNYSKKYWKLTNVWRAKLCPSTVSCIVVLSACPAVYWTNQNIHQFLMTRSDCWKSCKRKSYKWQFVLKPSACEYTELKHRALGAGRGH